MFPGELSLAEEGDGPVLSRHRIPEYGNTQPEVLRALRTHSTRNALEYVQSRSEIVIALTSCTRTRLSLSLIRVSKNNKPFGDK